VRVARIAKAEGGGSQLARLGTTEEGRKGEGLGGIKEPSRLAS